MRKIILSSLILLVLFFSGCSITINGPFSIIPVNTQGNALLGPHNDSVSTSDRLWNFLHKGYVFHLDTNFTLNTGTNMTLILLTDSNTSVMTHYESFYITCSNRNFQYSLYENSSYTGGTNITSEGINENRIKSSLKPVMQLFYNPTITTTGLKLDSDSSYGTTNNHLSASSTINIPWIFKYGTPYEIVIKNNGGGNNNYCNANYVWSEEPLSG